MVRMGVSLAAISARSVRACAVLALLTLTACGSDAPQSWLTPKGPNAQAVLDLFWPITYAAIVVFVVVQGLIIYTVMKYRERPGGPEAQQFHGNFTVELTSTIITALVFIVVLAATVSTQRVLSAPLESPPADAITVKVIGHQWWWEFQYPDDDIVTASDLVVPTGTTVLLNITSADVIHSFWVPMLAGKIDAIPGRMNRMWIKADADGTYSAQCAEFCGIEHAMMRFQVRAVGPNEYKEWVVRQKTVPPTPVAPSGADASLILQAKGAQLFVGGSCKTCHAIKGTEAVGVVGPNLTHFGSRETIAAKTLTSTVPNLKTWLRNPQAVKPGTIMPNLNLKEDEIEALTAYLCRPIDPTLNTGCQVAPANTVKK